MRLGAQAGFRFLLIDPMMAAATQQVLQRRSSAARGRGIRQACPALADRRYGWNTARLVHLTLQSRST